MSQLMENVKQGGRIILPSGLRIQILGRREDEIALVTGLGWVRIPVRFLTEGVEIEEPLDLDVVTGRKSTITITPEEEKAHQDGLFNGCLPLLTSEQWQACLNDTVY